jgi:hypothetical protein
VSPSFSPSWKSGRKQATFGYSRVTGTHMVELKGFFPTFHRIGFDEALRTALKLEKRLLKVFLRQYVMRKILKVLEGDVRGG